MWNFPRWKNWLPTTTDSARMMFLSHSPVCLCEFSLCCFSTSFNYCAADRCTQDFTMERVHVVEGHVRGYGKFLSGVQKLKQIVKLVYNLYRFPVENLGFNEYRSRAWTVYFANTIQKNLKIQWGVEPPSPTPYLGTPVGSHNYNFMSYKFVCWWKLSDRCCRPRPRLYWHPLKFKILEKHWHRRLNWFVNDDLRRSRRDMNREL